MSLANDLPTPDELKAKATETARKVGDHLSEQAYLLRDTAASARYNSEDYIQNNPWQSVCLAAAIGFLVGVIVARR
jgi:ElaB/YqjD/DUF883 family membrane-anchored ribosome-binding protein